MIAIIVTPFSFIKLIINEIATIFANAVNDQISGIVENIRKNVETAKGYYDDLLNTKTSSVVYENTHTNNTSENNGNQTPRDDVKVLQEILRYVYGENVAPTGIEDEATISALKSVQKTIGVNQSGEYNSETAAALKDNLQTRATRSRNNGHFDEAAMESDYSYKVPKAWYAHGTIGTKRDEWAVTDEPQFGDELVLVPGKDGNLSFMRKGTGVVPADLTANLIEWGKFTPDSFNIGSGVNINMINNAVNKPEFNFAFDALVKAENITEETLPAVKKLVTQELNRFTKELNYALKGKGAR